MLKVQTIRTVSAICDACKGYQGPSVRARASDSRGAIVRRLNRWHRMAGDRPIVRGRWVCRVCRSL